MKADQSVLVKYPFVVALAAGIEIAGVVPPLDTTGEVPLTEVTYVPPGCLLLNVLQSALLK